MQRVVVKMLYGVLFTPDTASLSPVFGKSPALGATLLVGYFSAERASRGTHFSATSLFLTVPIPHVE